MSAAKMILTVSLLSAVLFAASGCGEDNSQRLAYLQSILENRKALLEKKEAELAAAKEKQGTLRDIFRDTPEVNALQADVAELKNGIEATQREIRELQSGTYLIGWKMPLLLGFFISLIIVALMLFISIGAGVLDMGCAVICFFPVYWFLFSAAIKFIFF